MPCMCWYDPGDESRKLIKDLCQQLVDKIKELEKIGDPIGCDLRSIKELIDHLYDPRMCKERK